MKWKDSMTVEEKLIADKDWYYIPPYNNEGHKIADSAGQEVAVFELKEQALECVESHNYYIKPE